MSHTNLKAAVYARISRDPEGLRAGVERQLEDCRALAAREGLDVVAVYTDNDIGASTVTRKTKRPQYEAMMEAARRREFDVIVAYSNSRMTRRMSELEGLIQLHDAYGTKIKTVVSGEDDLATADGRMVARIKASVDAAEAERLSERSRRAGIQKARNGDTNKGQRAFGWQADKLTLDPAESALILEAANQVLDGVPIRTIARDWNERGIRTSYGKAWSHTTLRRSLQRPRLVGIQTYHREVLKDAAGEPVRGEWEPLMDLDLFDRLQVALNRANRAGGRSGARRYLLTGVARCGVCGGRMGGMKTPKSFAYTCQDNGKHTVTIAGPATEDDVTTLVKARLAMEDDLVEDIPDNAVGTDRLAEIPGLIAELMKAFTSGKVSGDIVFPQIELLETERAKLSTERAARIESTSQPRAIAASDFDDLDVDRQRAVISTFLEAVVVGPAARRGAPWTPDRLQYIWRKP